MKFDITPFVGAGPVQFGMTRHAVRQALGAPVEEFMKTPDSQTPTDDFMGLNLHVYYDNQLCCCGIEFFPHARATLHSKSIVGRPFSEVMQWLTKLDPSAVLDDSTVTSSLFGLSLYAPDADEDVDSLIQSVYISRRSS